MARIYTLQEFSADPPSEFRGILWNHYFSKAFDQLKGMCCGILADGKVTDEEAEFVRRWINRNAAVEQVWPFTEIARRVRAVFADGKITEEERVELREIMDEIIGGKMLPSPGNSEAPFEMALTKPPPDIVEFQNREFSLTGKFALGARSQVVDAIEARGGIFQSSPRHGTRYLVIGVFGSVNWKNSSFGNKIQRAATLREEGSNIAIILEETMARSMNSDTQTAV
jgi:NAD-dependent DNA ligase